MHLIEMSMKNSTEILKFLNRPKWKAEPYIILTNIWEWYSKKLTEIQVRTGNFKTGIKNASKSIRCKVILRQESREENERN